MFGGAMAPHCVCDKNFFGPACAGSCTVQDCGGHGVCGHDVDKNFAHCFCNTGYDGVDCTKSVRTSRDRAVHALSTLRSSHPPPFALSLSLSHTHTHTRTLLTRSHRALVVPSSSNLGWRRSSRHLTFYTLRSR